MNDEQAIELLESMVRIPSVSTQEAELVHFLQHEMARWGLKTEADAVGNFVAVAEGQQPGPTGVLLGHVDTVPGNLPVFRQEGRLHGRGSVDAKGPFAAFLAAVIRASQTPDSAGRWILIGCVEEEIPSSRGARHVLDLDRPDWCLVGEPSGWNGITLGYKGCLTTELQFEAPRSHGAHASDTICEIALRAWQRIESARARFNMGKNKLYTQLLSALESFHHTEEDGHERARLRATFRLPPDFGPAEVEGWLRDLVPDARLSVMGGVPAWAGPRSNPLTTSLQRAILQNGGKARFLHKTGTADLNLVGPAWGCPAAAYGPGDSSLDHTPEEHIVLAEYLRSIHILHATLGTLAHRPVQAGGG